MRNGLISIAANILISVIVFWLYTYRPAVAIALIALLILNNIDRVLLRIERSKESK